jgi:lysophospholipase L1-like esterase
MKIQPGSKLLFIGDSITAGGRNVSQPGEGRTDEAYGSGYVLFVKSLLEIIQPDSRIRVLNRGVSGNTVRELATRWQADVLDIRPDWLSVMIGINDVWRQFDTPLRTEIHVSLEEYTTTLRSLLAAVRPSLKGLVICSPYVIDANSADPMRAAMDRYGAAARSLAKEFDATFVDTQTAFDDYLRHHHPNQLCWDRIHPSATGHMLIAKAWLDAMGFEWAPSCRSNAR